MASSSAAAGLLGRQLKQMNHSKDLPGISCGLVDNNVFEWEVMLMINDDCKFYGGKLVTTLRLTSLGFGKTLAVLIALSH
jgi:ubiquitin-protein ligase